MKNLTKITLKITVRRVDTDQMPQGTSTLHKLPEMKKMKKSDLGMTIRALALIFSI